MSKATKYNWTPRKRNYGEEWEDVNKTSSAYSKPLASFPLQPNVKPEATKKQAQQAQLEDKSESFVDPLSQKEDDNVLGVDPLSQPQQQGKNVSQIITGMLNRASIRKQKSDFLNWQMKKTAYLKRYTTDKAVPVISKIVYDEEDGQKAISLEDRLKMRLEQLERETSQPDVSYMTQQEYISHLEKLNEDLKHNWTVLNDRVASLKIVIKCAKILALNTVPQFYPSMFVLVAQVLDQFGELVFNRIKEKSSYKDGGRLIKLSDNFTCADVSDEAKEVCRNWFFKVASIRELTARIYVEMAIIGCNRFLFDDRKKLIADFERIARTIRGIGDPLIATHARLYLARRGVELIPEEKQYLQTLIDDFFTTWMKQIEGDQKFLIAAQLSKQQYLILYAPALEWFFEAYGNNASEKVFNELLQKYESFSKQTMTLNYIINGFEPSIIANNASLLVFMIKNADDGAMPRYQVFKTLGEKFCTCPPEKQKMQLLNEIWKEVTVVENLQEYVKIVETYVEFVSRSFSLREVNILLADLRKHIAAQGGASDKIENELKHILLTILENTKDFIEVFNMEHFLPIFDLLKSNSQTEVSKGMLIAFAKRERVAADPVVIGALSDLAKTVHDSITVLSEERDKQEIAQLLVNFINKIDFGTAFEKQLNFFVECRRSFSSFDEVKEALTMQVLRMVAKTYEFVKGKHTKKTNEFVKACLAFAHITIPSIDNLFKRLHLYVLAGQVAVMNNLLGQADVLFKIAIETLPDVPSLLVMNDNTAVSTETLLVEFVNTLASCFISIPSHPELGPFYLFRGLFNVLQDYKWQKGSDAKIKVFISLLNSLCSLYQEQLPYSYVGVNSNDSLFAGDQAYLDDIVAIGNTIMEEVLTHMATLQQDEDVSMLKKQAACSMDLFNHLVSMCDLNAQTMSLAHKLFGLSQKSAEKGSQLEQYVKNSLNSLKKKGVNAAQSSPYQLLYSKLATAQ